MLVGYTYVIMIESLGALLLSNPTLDLDPEAGPQEIYKEQLLAVFRARFTVKIYVQA